MEIKITKVIVKPDERVIVGNYDVINTNRDVIARQSFNGDWSTAIVSWSPETREATITLLACLKRDVEQVLGFKKSEDTM